MLKGLDILEIFLQIHQFIPKSINKAMKLTKKRLLL